MEIGGTEVGVGARIVVLLGGVLQHLRLHGIILNQRGDVEQFLVVQLIELAAVDQRLHLGVALTGDLHVVDQLGAAQFRQHVLFEFAVNRRHVLDLVLALGRRIVHAQHLKNQILVLDVRLLDHLLETFPVLAVTGSVDIETVLGQDLLDGLATGLATCAGQLVVELLRTVGRSVAVHIEALRDAVVLLVGHSGFLELGELFVLFERLLVHHRAVDLVEDLGLVYLIRRTLVVVGSRSGSVAEVEILLHRVDALGDEHAALSAQRHGLGRLRIGQHGRFLLRHGFARSGVEHHVLAGAVALALDQNAQLALLHTVVVGEFDMLRVGTAVVGRNNGIVVIHLLALDVFRSTGHFAALEHDHRRQTQRSFLVEISCREVHRNVGAHDAVVERQHLRCARVSNLILFLTHLLETVATR